MWSISNWFRRISTTWVTLLVFGFFLVFMFVVLPGQAANAEIQSQGGDSPDTSLTYSKSELYTMAENYGRDGRIAYIRTRWTFDLIFPFVYTAFLVTSISWLFQKAFPANSPWQLANLAPLVGMIFDFLENTATTLVFSRYPDTTPVVDVLAPLFTLVKWIFVGGSFFLVFLGLGLIFGSWIRRKITPIQS